MTRRFSRWPAAIALIIGAAPTAALAQAAGSDLPPPPPRTTAAPAKKAPGPPGVAAVVNGQRISMTQVNALVTPRLASIREQLSAQAAQLLINNTLIDQQAKKEKITVTPTEISARLVQLQQQIGGQVPGGFTAFLKSRGLTLADARDQVRIQIEAEKLVSKTLPAAPPMVHTRHVLVLTTNPGNSPAVKPHSDEDAKKIIDQAQADLKSGKSFAEVARQYSEDPGTKDKGGDDGWISQNTPYVPAFLQAALKLKPGETTVVKTPEYGYFLIKADATSATATGAERTSYQAAETAMRQQQIQQALSTYLQNLRRTAKITDYLAP